MGGSTCANFDGVTLPDELRAVAERELGETPERRDAALASLRAKLAALPAADAPVPEDLSDAALLRALRPRKFDVARAFDLIKSLQAFKRDYPQYFDAAALAKAKCHFRRIAGCGFMAVLPTLSPAGHRVVVSAPALMPEELLADAEATEAVLVFGFWLCDRLVRDPAVQVHGMACLVSYAGMSFGRFMALSGLLPLPVRLRFQRCFAVRYGSVLIFEAPPFFAAFFALLRPLLPAKLAQRVRFVGDGPDEALAATRELVPDAAAPLAGADDAATREAALAWLDEQLRLEERGF